MHGDKYSQELHARRIVRANEGREAHDAYHRCTCREKTNA